MVLGMKNDLIEWNINVDFHSICNNFVCLHIYAFNALLYDPISFPTYPYASSLHSVFGIVIAVFLIP